MELEFQHESLSEEIKVRLTSSQLLSLETVARNNVSKPSSFARWIIHEFLMEHDAEYSAAFKERKPYGKSSLKSGEQQKSTFRKSPTKAKRAKLTDIQEVSFSIFDSIPAGWPDHRHAIKPKRTIMVPKGKYPTDAFGLDVIGDSMNTARGKLGPVLPGETVVLVPFTSADEAAGKIVAAMIDGQTTLKRLFCPKGSACYLRAESKNPAFAGKIHPLHDLEVQGVMIGKLP